MNESGPKQSVDTGYREGYQDSVAVESEVLFGMDSDEFYRRQTGLVLDEIPNSLYEGGDLEASKPVDLNEIQGEEVVELDKVTKIKQYMFLKGKQGPDSVAKIAKKLGIEITDKCDLNLGQGSKVLDLAAGEGDTSRYLATTGAEVDSQDLSPHLVEQAEKKDNSLRNIRKLQNVTRARLKSYLLGDVDYRESDMGHVKDTLDDDEIGTYDAVTIMSRSFIYLKEKAKYEKALKDYFDVLKPGGKLVIQMRERIKPPEMPWLEEKGGKCETIENENGKIFRMENANGDAYVIDSSVDSTQPDGTVTNEFHRYMEYADGSTVDMGTPEADHLINLKNLEWVNEILKKAGFRNIKLKAQYLAKDDTEIMYAIVAEKPEK